MARLPEYWQDATTSPQWDDPPLTLGLRASEVPPEVAKAVSERRFTAEFAEMLDDFVELEQQAYQEARDHVGRVVEEQHGDWQQVSDEHLQEMETPYEQAVRSVLKRHWANYRKRANRKDPSFKCRLPDLKKEAAEWVLQALDAAARRRWEQELKYTFTSPADERLFMPYYT